MKVVKIPANDNIHYNANITNDRDIYGEFTGAGITQIQYEAVLAKDASWSENGNYHLDIVTWKTNLKTDRPALRLHPR